MGGPLILMGIDAEDGGPGGHGPITVYENIVNSILSDVTKAGSGILVIGGGKDTTPPVDNVTDFWDTISTAIGVPVTYVNGAAAIATQPFSSFLMLAVVSSEPQTPSGGLTELENLSLNTRQTDIANFINSGGGLLGFSQTGLTTQFAYLGGVGSITTTSGLNYNTIAPTPAGTAVGITTDLNVDFWHEVFNTFPAFLQILALNDTVGNPGFGIPAAIGGAEVVVPIRGISLF
ncbi:hypothetical protein AXX12_01185 [Anaerosporomusa subterranea]|uniref:Uncharacterized protein n=1 Tax=Anaerosporomusa subterranea TaxID=1794912 RepID=A0A154BW89_ANASB|nr:hypothetical protein [Anaerosporomusa subterranea]KYZ78187.1 hypothetical protein AXX12_01185 [Anaerosporomusa subterranea]